MSDGRLKPKGSGGLSGRALLARWIVRGRMTQQEAADQIGVSRVKLNQYLHAAALPSLETAIRIEDASGIPVRSWLVEEADARDRNIAADPGMSDAPNGRVSDVNIISKNRTPPGV
jgi:transcriptional regulator with XRE-family HTH domain